MNKAILKSQIRENVRTERKQLTEKQIRSSAEALVEHLITDLDPELSNLISSAKTIALYRAINGELSCDLISRYLFDQGKVVCFPRVKGETMDFYEVEDLDKDFSAGAYGVPEPKSGTRKIYPNDIDIILVPAVAYTKDGARLGQGGGYYDRYLAAHQVQTIGICYADCRMTQLPHDNYDRKLMCCVTEQKTEDFYG